MKNSPRILLVDDDKDMCESLSDVLTLDSDYIVEHTTDPLTVTEMVKNNKYSLIVLDYKMPGMNGMELLGKIKQISPKTVVFILTAFISPDLVDEAKNKGAEKVLSKFIWPEDILKHINKYIKSSS